MAQGRPHGEASGPGADSGDLPRRAEWKGRLGVAFYLVGGAAVVLGLLGWGAVAAMRSTSGLPDNHVAKTDSRVCPDTVANNLSYADAVHHFSLSVPKDASGLVFTASTHPLFGEASLDLRFTTTPAGLSAFLAVSGFPSPVTDTTLGLGDWSYYVPGRPPKDASGACGLHPAVRPGMTYAEDTSSGRRFLAVDSTDPGHPVVWVSAMDM
ncbi:hypothetical protein [Kitasatospora sp. DSM 101779]|uniref:hypothetical protein n=1 Tax=Kitasatospora sp. DSM 101779 TaxID=2853165 RepID=UPI0021DAFADF|nr:hypothetical protein [Kitasatospora sp. DSM 101779]MCU7826515.1 hypothetical protein [Kitasatospora sp. DSM 101779]